MIAALWAAIFLLRIAVKRHNYIEPKKIAGEKIQRKEFEKQ